MPSGESAPAGDSMALRDVAEAVGLITAPAAGLATLALYFGWRRTQSYAQYFGVDNSILEYSVQDYVLRSAGSVYRIVQVAVIAGLLALIAHRVLSTIRGRPAGQLAGAVIATGAAFALLIWAGSPISRMCGAPLPRMSAFATLVGAGTLAIVLFRGLHAQRCGASPPAQVSPPARVQVVSLVLLAVGLFALDSLAVPARAAVLRAPYLAVDTLLALGLVLFGYAFFISRPPGPGGDPMWMRTLLIVFCGLLVLVGMFAATDEYAQAVGTREAELTAARLPDRRGVIIYSAENLDLPPVVHCVRLVGKDEAFHFRCDGLRLFARVGKGTLVLPQNWSRADGLTADDRIIVVPDEDPAIRLEFTPGAGDIPPDPL
jgi:hypothetical protein